MKSTKTQRILDFSYDSICLRFGIFIWHAFFHLSSESLFINAEILTAIKVVEWKEHTPHVSTQQHLTTWANEIKGGPET